MKPPRHALLIVAIGPHKGESARHEQAEEEHEQKERKLIGGLKKMQGSKGHAGKERKAIDALSRLEKSERRGPKYPKEAGEYVR